MQGIDALAHPVRLRIVRHLSDHERASLGELARAADVHENTARTHLTALQDAGLITAERRPLDRPGRPGVNYRLVNAHLVAPTQLAQLLGVALDRAGPSDDELRATGRDWGRYLAGRPGPHEIKTKIPEVLEQIGLPVCCPSTRPPAPRLLPGRRRSRWSDGCIRRHPPHRCHRARSATADVSNRAREGSRTRPRRLQGRRRVAQPPARVEREKRPVLRVSPAGWT
jgi:DNA-binding transcriptional ArsR family regulator